MFHFPLIVARLFHFSERIVPLCERRGLFLEVLITSLFHRSINTTRVSVTSSTASSVGNFPFFNLLALVPRLW